MTYIITWLVVFVLNGMPGMQEIRQNSPTFDTQQSCLEYVSQHKERITDVVRGAMGMPFETEMQADGVCLEKETDGQKTQL